VQSVARDVMAGALQRLEAAGYPVVLHVHDEIVCEVPEGFGSIEEFHRLLTIVPDWTEGLPLAAKAWTRQRYAKSKATTGEMAPTIVNGAALDTPAARTKIEIPLASPQAAPAAPVTENDEDDEDGPSWTEIPLADLIAEPLIGGKMLCPFHDDHTPSLQIYPDHFRCYVCGAGGNQLDWLMRAEGMSRVEALDLLNAWDGPLQVQVFDDGGEARHTFALRLWEEAQPIAGTLAARYLSDTRKINLAALPANIDEALRFHPRCPFGRGNRNPCLIALMRDARTDAPTGIQRIGLTADAKKIDRLMLGRSGIVKVWPAGPQLVVGEGLETVCAAASCIPYEGALLQPAWSALSAEGLGQFPILPGIQRLIILVDHDPPGKTAASYCAGRWERAGRSVIQLTPDEPGFDFNDIVMAE
jgi:CHC2 zinc finger/Toprim domain